MSFQFQTPSPSKEIQIEDIITHDESLKFFNESGIIGCINPENQTILSEDFFEAITTYYDNIFNSLKGDELEAIQQMLQEKLTVNNGNYVSLNALQVFTKDQGLENLITGLIQEDKLNQKEEINHQIYEEITKIQESLKQKQINLDKRELVLVEREKEINCKETYFKNIILEHFAEQMENSEEYFSFYLQNITKQSQQLEKNYKQKLKIIETKARELRTSQQSKLIQQDKYKFKNIQLEKANELSKQKVIDLDKKLQQLQDTNYQLQQKNEQNEKKITQYSMQIKKLTQMLIKPDSLEVGIQCQDAEDIENEDNNEMDQDVNETIKCKKQYLIDQTQLVNNKQEQQQQQQTHNKFGKKETENIQNEWKGNYKDLLGFVCNLIQNFREINQQPAQQQQDEEQNSKFTESILPVLCDILPKIFKFQNSSESFCIIELFIELITNKLFENERTYASESKLSIPLVMLNNYIDDKQNLTQRQLVGEIKKLLVSSDENWSKKLNCQNKENTKQFKQKKQQQISLNLSKDQVIHLMHLLFLLSDSSEDLFLSVQCISNYIDNYSIKELQNFKVYFLQSGLAKILFKLTELYSSLEFLQPTTDILLQLSPSDTTYNEFISILEEQNYIQPIFETFQKMLQQLIKYSELHNNSSKLEELQELCQNMAIVIQIACSVGRFQDSLDQNQKYLQVLKKQIVLISGIKDTDFLVSNIKSIINNIEY